MMPTQPITEPTPLDPEHRVHRLLLVLVLMISALVQFTMVARSETAAPLRADAGVYFSCAWNLRHEGVFSSAGTWQVPGTPAVPDALVAPGYPLFLAAVPGLSPAPAYVRRVGFIQAGLGVLSVWLAFLIARAFLRPRWALAAAALAALSPHLATISTYVLTESLFQALLLASLYASVRATRSSSMRGWVVAGLLWGSCCLVRPTMQFLPALFLLGTFALPGLRAHRRAAATLLVAFLLVQLPWQLRNLSLPPQPGAPNLTVSFLHNGSYPDFKYQGRDETYGFPYRFDPDNEQASHDLHSALRDIAGKFAARPLEYTRWYLIGKPQEFLNWDLSAGGFGDVFIYPPIRSPYLQDIRFAVIRTLMQYLHWPLMWVGLAGAAFACWRPRSLGVGESGVLPARLLAATVIYAIGFHMVGAPFPRYGVPFRSLFYMFAMLPVAALVSVRVRRPPIAQTG